MNPDKLFDYLDDRLPDHERYELEKRLMSDAQLQRELDVARRIHAGMRAQRTDRPEVLGESSDATAARGRRMARQVALAFLVLVAMNVALGLLYIARHESKNPNRALLEKQSREQIQQSLEKSAATSLPTPELGVVNITVSVETGHLSEVADAIVAGANELHGSATKGVIDNGTVQVLAELDANNAADFSNKIRNVTGVREVKSDNAMPNGNVSFLIRVSEAK